MSRPLETTMDGVGNQSVVAAPVRIALPAMYETVSKSQGVKRHWWLVDSCCGRTMSPDPDDFVYLEPWTGGEVQVGTGDVRQTTHRGIVVLYARDVLNGKQVALPQFKWAWLVPDIVFKIIAVSDSTENGVSCIFGDVGPCSDYLRINSTGVKIKVKKYHGIYVLPTVNIAQVHPHVRVKSEEMSVQRKEHLDITDLWYVFGRKQPVNGGVMLVDESLGQYVPPGDALCLSHVLNLDLGSNPYEEDDDAYGFQDACRDIDLCHVHNVFPESMFQSTSVSSDHVFSLLARPLQEWVPINNNEGLASRSSWDWCASRHCENPQCQQHICGVNRSSVSRTSSYSRQKSNALLQHYRHACTSGRTLYRACKNGFAAGMDVKRDLDCRCPVCMLCKGKKASTVKVTKSEEQKDYERSQNTLVFDFCGPMRVRSNDGAIGFFGVKHVHRKYYQLFPVQSRSEAAACVREAILHLRKKYAIWVWHVHTDNAKEHLGQNWKAVEDELNFYTSFAPDYTPVKNSQAEHMNYIICTMALCMMVLADAPKWSWALACLYATQIYNANPPASGDEPSPLQLVTGYVPDHSMFRVFWCDAYPLFHKEQGRGKFDLKARGSLKSPCKFVGMSPRQPDSWLVYDPIRNICIETGHCGFDESKFDGTTMFNNTELPPDEFEKLMQSLASDVGVPWEEVEAVLGGVGPGCADDQFVGSSASGGVAGEGVGKAQQQQPVNEVHRGSRATGRADVQKNSFRGYGFSSTNNSSSFRSGDDRSNSNSNSNVRSAEEVFPPMTEEFDVEAPEVASFGEQGGEAQVEGSGVADTHTSPSVDRSMPSTPETDHLCEHEARQVREAQSRAGEVWPMDPQHQRGPHNAIGEARGLHELAAREQGVSVVYPRTRAQHAAAAAEGQDFQQVTTSAEGSSSSSSNSSNETGEGAGSAGVSQADAGSQVSQEQFDSLTHVLNVTARAISRIQEQIAHEGAQPLVDEIIIAAAIAQEMEKEGVESRMPDPCSYDEAMARPDWESWLAALKKEIDGMIKLGVWVEVDEKDVPRGTSIMKSKMVWKLKYKADNTIEKYKCRLVACGYSQVYGVNFTETYAGVVDPVVIRIFLAVVAVLGLFTKKIDVSQAFLYGELEEGEDVYMRLPSYLGGGVVKLIKALYGLKQAGRTFNRKLTKFMLSLGFQQSIIEPCLFYMFTEAADVEDRYNGVGIIYVICHVDDCPVASNSQTLLDWFEKQFRKVFEITVEPLDYFVSLSIEVTQTGVCFHQEHYVKQLLSKFNDYLVQFCSNGNGEIIGKDTTGVPGKVLSKQQLPQTEEEKLQVQGLPYAQLVGALLYLSHMSRADIMVAVSYCSKFMSNFGMDHWMAALHVLQYLYKYPKVPVTYVRSENGDGLILMYEADASYADCPDTARSRYGCVGYLAGAFIDVKTGVFKNVQPSTGAAEQSSLARCVLRVLAARQYMECFGFPQNGPTPIGEDNMAALLNSRNPVKSKLARHLHVFHHITRENQMEFKTINVYRLGTENMSADAQTKILNKFLHWKHTSRQFNLVILHYGD